ncbi:hypothetical protein JYK14_27960 [Siccirubricoccus sp. KC 17139]|uniref:STAS domain-containing protein n=1 Tax=Siccirubricoccus soli TaxID=2899147 RepID=A0ABT1DFJ9_9PROT|nr:hypothetical protein [Siccirubricoccus soli]MCO6419969.1 hypothetical protein [Siccirubricoccus soli]MCP2686104.1 hypothetical protein [Siccirubricoccus soli]
MSVQLQDAVVHLRGDCPVEDAELLLSLLREGGGRMVQIGEADRLHTAVVQVLLALRPPLAGAPTDPFLSRWLVPLLRAPAGDGEAARMAADTAPRTTQAS